jgi:hypothetical protein
MYLWCSICFDLPTQLIPIIVVPVTRVCRLQIYISKTFANRNLSTVIHRNLRSLECWDRGFESHLRHGCMYCVPLFCVCVVLCIGRGLTTGWSPVLGVLSTVYTYLLMELSPSWEAASCAATQELPSILWNPKVHYRVHKSRPPVPILSHIDSVHTIPSYLRSILILSTHLRLGFLRGLFAIGSRNWKAAKAQQRAVEQ